MTKLEQLIQELCPNGVEYIKIFDLCDRKNGYTPSKAKKEYWLNGTIPWFRMEDIRENGRILSESSQHVTIEAVKGDIFPANSIIVATSATIGEHALITVPFITNQRFTCLSVKKQYQSIINIRFLYYCCFKLDSYCFECLNQGNFASVDMKKFSMFMFPVPPLEVQAEIVRILDKFTELTTELTTELATELANRKKQYEYYRHRILSIHSDKKLALEEIFYIRNGYTPSKKNPEYWENGDIQWFRLEDIRQNGRILTRAIKQINSKGVKKSGVIKKNSIMMSTTATLGEHALVCVDYLSNQQITNFTIKEAYQEYLLLKFAYYCFFELGKSLSAIANYSGGIPIVDQNKLKKLTLPIPPIEEQRLIVAILDRFDKLCNDISEGLPAEIDARQKQYEYYRDKLLTFKELK